jgi:hypothetical protein
MPLKFEGDAAQTKLRIRYPESGDCIAALQHLSKGSILIGLAPSSLL